MYSYVGDIVAGPDAFGVFSVDLYLREEVTGSSTSRIFTDGGLFGAGVMISRVSGDGTIAGDFKIVPNTAAPPTGFGPPTIISQTPATATQAGLIVNGDVPAQGPNVGPGGGQILLGTVGIKPGLETTVWAISNYGGTGDTITQLGTDLDFDTAAENGYFGAARFGAYQIVALGVPEPSTGALFGISLLTTGGFVLRRRRP
jgi:hypothetical protein